MSNSKIKLILLLSLFFLIGTTKGYCTNPTKNSKTGFNYGPATWVNIWNYPEDKDISAFCQKNFSYGITNIIVQTSRSNTQAIVNPQKLSLIIESCHKYGIKVFGWTYPNLTNIDLDANKLVEAANFTTPTGQKLDGMVANLEHNLSESNVSSFSTKIRSKLNQNYFLIACVYSPLNRCQEVKKTPWKTLAKYYNAIAPMIYWNSKYKKYDTYDYTVSSIQSIRQLTNMPYLNIHAIGDGMKTNPNSINDFLRACRDSYVSSISLYPQNQLTKQQLVELSNFTKFLDPEITLKLKSVKYFYDQNMANLYGNNLNHIVTENEYLNFLQNKLGSNPMISKKLDFIKSSSTQSSNLPISKSRAMDILAFITDTNNKPETKSWFINKAYAQNANKSQELNYLDMTFITLQALRSLN